MRSLRRRAFKLVYVLYYKVLFGRRFPGSKRLAEKVHAWELATGRGDAPISKETWEAQYRKGGWAFMRNLDELARYSVIGGYLHALKPGASVLDVGAGEGLLVDQLRIIGYSHYLGIDLSEAAIEQAAGRQDERTLFQAADAETFTPEGKWDVIVFNECVYYFKDPIGTVERYKRYLEDGGVMVVSMYRSRRSDMISKRLVDLGELQVETTVANRKGAWVVQVFR